jgi:hypothetical protein
MTSLIFERFGRPSSTRDRRVERWDEERSAEDLAGRTVWSMSALPGGRAAAQRVRDCLAAAEGSALSLGRAEASAGEPLHALAQQLDDMLSGAIAEPAPLGSEQAQVYADGLRRCESMVDAQVRRDDIVVLHDPLVALMAEAARERGAHVVWHVRIGGLERGASVGVAWAFLRRYTPAVDAHVTSWRQRGRSAPLERIAALIPSAGLVAAKEIVAQGRERGRGWRSVLADVVEEDRGEAVGGTRHARPTVAAR